jgi:hypothetical protein
MLSSRVFEVNWLPQILYALLQKTFQGTKRKQNAFHRHTEPGLYINLIFRVPQMRFAESAGNLSAVQSFSRSGRLFHGPTTRTANAFSPNLVWRVARRCVLARGSLSYVTGFAILKTIKFKNVLPGHVTYNMRDAG